MPIVDIVDNFCLYRDLDVENASLMVVVYSSTLKSFYQSTISNDEWIAMAPNFTLSDLDTIFRVCIDKQKDYSITINEYESRCELIFNCVEAIKTYNWTFTLEEKSTEDFLKIRDHVQNLRTIFDSYNTILFPQSTNTDLGQSFIDTHQSSLAESTLFTQNINTDTLTTTESTNVDNYTDSTTPYQTPTTQLVQYTQSTFDDLLTLINSYGEFNKISVFLLPYIAELSERELILSASDDDSDDEELIVSKKKSDKKPNRVESDSESSEKSSVFSDDDDDDNDNENPPFVPSSSYHNILSFTKADKKSFQKSHNKSHWAKCNSDSESDSDSDYIPIKKTAAHAKKPAKKTKFVCKKKSKK